MAMHYSDETRASDPHALPDIEVFYRNADEATWTDDNGEQINDGPGWYWWSCFPGCLPDSDPHGPFETEADALADAREGVE